MATGLLTAALLVCAATPAERLAKEAEKAERSGQIIQAYLLWAEAAAAEPKSIDYWSHAQRLRPTATLLTEKKLPAMGEKLVAPPPSDIVGSLTRKDYEDLERMASAPHLKPVPGLRDYHMRENARASFEKLAAGFSYTVIFEKDYPDVADPIRFDVTEVDYKGALHALEQATNSFIVPLSDRTMLVAQDTPQKRVDLETNVAVAIPIPQRTSIQEAQELMISVQQTLELRRFVMDGTKRVIFMRDRASKVELASALLNQLSASKPQVSIEVEFISSGASSSLSLGLNLPMAYQLVDFGSVLHSRPSIAAGFTRFLTFGGGKTFMGIGISDAQLFATATRSESSTLMKTVLNGSDGLPMTLHVGDKYPIQTAAYLGGGSLGGGGGITGGGTTYVALSTASYADIYNPTVSLKGNMKIVVNGQSTPFTLPAGANNMAGLENVINSLQLGVGAVSLRRGTTDRPYSYLLVASTLGISSIQLIDDPDGAKIALVKNADVLSSLSIGSLPDPDISRVSKNGALNLMVGTNTTPLILADAINNLYGLRDAINKSGAKVTAAVLSTGLAPNPYFLQVVAQDNTITDLQLYDEPNGANTALLVRTDEVNSGSATGNAVAGTRNATLNLGQNYTPPPTFNFEDLGLSIKITPYVHNADEVTLEVEAEFKVLGNGSYNGVPVISNRKFQSKIRLKTSEDAIVAGLMSDTQARTISGLAGLSRIPILGPLTRQNTKSHDTSEVLIVIKPRVTSLPGDEVPARALWFGSETKPSTVL